MIRITRAQALLTAVAFAFLLPGAIPGVGIDFTYFFIMVLVLSAWFMLKWNTVNALPSRGTTLEVILGSVVIASIYSYKVLNATRLGLLDMLIIFGALVVAFYGLKSFKLFWVPTTYGIALLAGYQL